MLEECGLDYRLTPLDIAHGAQFEDWFLDMNPNARMPVMVDHDAKGGPLSIFESGAILVYLGRKTGRFLPADDRGYYDVLQWVFWQMANLGPVAGHGNHFISYAPEENAYAKLRFKREYRRLLAVLNYQLMRGEYLIGDQYTIADMAIFPWLYNYRKFDTELTEFEQVHRWRQMLKQRPALQRGMDVGRMPQTEPENFKPDEKIRKLFFEQDESFYAGKRPPPR